MSQPIAEHEAQQKRCPYQLAHEGEGTCLGRECMAWTFLRQPPKIDVPQQQQGAVLTYEPPTAEQVEDDPDTHLLGVCNALPKVELSFVMPGQQMPGGFPGA